MDLPGGEIEQTETPESALVREINEEIGLDLSQAEFKLIYASTMPHEGVIAIRLVYYLRTSEKPKIHLSWEHDQSLWCSVVEAEKLLPRGKYKQQALAFLLENKVIEDL
jgi:8-oxo-dGTP pyrophosphatase MutT (NUDIX family)